MGKTHNLHKDGGSKVCSVKATQGQGAPEDFSLTDKALKGKNPSMPHPSRCKLPSHLPTL